MCYNDDEDDYFCHNCSKPPQETEWCEVCETCECMCECDED